MEKSIGPVPLQKCVGDFCCIKFWRILLVISLQASSGHFFTQKESKKSSEKFAETSGGPKTEIREKSVLPKTWGNLKQHRKLQQPRNYDFGMFQFNLLGCQGGNSREMTTSPPGHHWKATVLHSQQLPNYNNSKPTAVKWRVRNSTIAAEGAWDFASFHGGCRSSAFWTSLKTNPKIYPRLCLWIAASGSERGHSYHACCWPRGQEICTCQDRTLWLKKRKGPMLKMPLWGPIISMVSWVFRVWYTIRLLWITQLIPRECFDEIILKSLR